MFVNVCVCSGGDCVVFVCVCGDVCIVVVCVCMGVCMLVSV